MTCKRTLGTLALVSLVASVPLLQGAGIIRSIRMLAEEAAAAAFQNGDLGSLIPTKIGTAARQGSESGLREALNSAPSLNHGVKAVAAGGSAVAATRARASGPPNGDLSVFTQPADAQVRIMNIGPTYHDGMTLQYGRYDVEVSAPGYRTKRFPLEVNSDQVGVDVSLTPRNGFPCQPDIVRYGGDNLGYYGFQVRVEQVLTDTSLYEVYSSLAAYYSTESNYLHDAETRLSKNYAYITAYQNSNLSEDDIRNNRNVAVDERAIKLHVGLEKHAPNSVRYIAYTRLPPMALTSDKWVKGAHCTMMEAL